MEVLLAPIAFPAAFPLKDVTSSRLSSANRIQNGKAFEEVKPTFVAPRVPQSVFTVIEPTSRRNDPYNWNWRVLPVVSIPIPTEEPEYDSPAESENAVCTALVQFKCHHAEFSSTFDLRKGQYVVVQGDRGIDVGVVIRINADDVKQYVERTGPTASVIRYATQREVDYWATDLKADEAAALEYCRQRVLKHRLAMDVRHAEYQFDKKKLTFYYEAKCRVDFVTLNKELFREFSCRIWMEKVRAHE